MNKEEKYQFIINNMQFRMNLEQFIANNVDTSIEEVNDVIKSAFDETSPAESTRGIFRKDKFTALITKMRNAVYGEHIRQELDKVLDYLKNN